MGIVRSDHLYLTLCTVQWHLNKAVISTFGRFERWVFLWEVARSLAISQTGWVSSILLSLPLRCALFAMRVCGCLQGVAPPC